MTDQSKLKVFIEYSDGMWFASAKCGNERVSESGPSFDEVWENIKYAVSDQWCFGENHPYETSDEDEEEDCL